jgi:hypothetical protein
MWFGTSRAFTISWENQRHYTRQGLENNVVTALAEDSLGEFDWIRQWQEVFQSILLSI